MIDDPMDDRERIVRIIEETAGFLGYAVYETSLLLKGANSRFTVKIDHQEGISLKDCEKFSRELGKRLDDAEIVPNYYLEISSPGLNRKLRDLKDFIRFVKSPVKVIFESEGKRGVVKGILQEVRGDLIDIATEKDLVSVNIDQIVNANLDY